MEQGEIAQALAELGMPEKPALVYLLLLRSKRMSVAEITRSAQLKRATCYEYLDLLLKKEFIVRVPVGKRILYAAVSPSKILLRFKRESRKVEQVLMQLTTVHDAAVHKPKITFYEGKREIKHIYEEVFKTLGQAQSIFPPTTFFESFTEEEYSEFDKIAGNHAFVSRDLIVPDKFYKKVMEMRAKNVPIEKKSSKKLPQSFKTNVDVLIFNDKVALISLRDLSAIVIENKDIAELFQSMHSHIWKTL